MKLFKLFKEKVISGKSNLEEIFASEETIKKAIETKIKIDFMPPENMKNWCSDLTIKIISAKDNEEIGYYYEKNISHGDTITLNGMKFISDIEVT